MLQIQAGARALLLEMLSQRSAPWPTPSPACALGWLLITSCGSACRDDGPDPRVGLRVPAAAAGHRHAGRPVTGAGLSPGDLDVTPLLVQHGTGEISLRQQWPITRWAGWVVS